MGGRRAGSRGSTSTSAPGEKIGIVGASGAGKSTLVALLLRLYDVEEGRVLVDGKDLRGLTQESLRRQIGMVTQETAMFNRSAFDNIRYGRPDASRAEVEAAARAAQAHDFIPGCATTWAAPAMTRIWANAACGCRAASGSASRWRAPS
jgi:ATP-binding cassette, subfamily B, bacterial